MQSDDVIEIRWHGRGGQGVVTAAKLLAEAALDSDWFFQAFPDYGPERSGAPVRAYTRLSKGPINDHSQIYEPDIVILLDSTLLELIDPVEGLDAQDGTFIVNTPNSPDEIRKRVNFDGGKVITVDASRIAMEAFGREITNTPMLGAFARATGLFDLDELETQIRHKFERKLSPEIIEANVKALREASTAIQEG